MAEEANVDITTENAETQTAEQTEVKTFTQDEVNTIVQERLDKFKKKMPSQDDLKAFTDWKESQKTEAEKALEKDKEIESLKAELIIERNKNLVKDANVDSKYQRFILSEITAMEGNFEDNLKEYLTNNPQYLHTNAETSKKDDGVSVSKLNKSEEDGVLAILKSKHPNAF